MGDMAESVMTIFLKLAERETWSTFLRQKKELRVKPGARLDDAVFIIDLEGLIAGDLLGRDFF